MSVSLARFPWWGWSNGKGKKPETGSGSKPKEAKLMAKKVKKKWKSREERKRGMEQEYDVVLVPSDGVCLSASDDDDSSYDSDWSVGWMEPHAPEFDDTDDSFAVLVPCYRNNDCKGVKMEEQQSSDQLLNVLTDVPNGFPAEGNKYMEQWLASLQNI